MTETSSKTCTACFKDIDSRALRCSFCTQRQGEVGLYRDVPGRVGAGVTAAIAQHFNWDVTLARVAFIVSISLLGPIAVWAYLAVWLMTPFTQAGKTPLARLFDALAKLFSPTPADVETGEQPVKQ